MWSGPRNLSTAMMYAFGARSDCAVWDEPFYAAYLHETKKNHPMRKEILLSQPSDRKTVIHQCTGTSVPKGRMVYQKLMTHHMLPHSTTFHHPISRINHSSAFHFIIYLSQCTAFQYTVITYSSHLSTFDHISSHLSRRITCATSHHVLSYTYHSVPHLERD